MLYLSEFYYYFGIKIPLNFGLNVVNKNFKLSNFFNVNKNVEYLLNST